MCSKNCDYCLQDVLQFSFGAEASLKKRKRQDGSTEYTVVARHSPLTGRIEAETGDDDAERDALYRECISWCNPVEYEKYLQQVGYIYPCFCCDSEHVSLFSLCTFVGALHELHC